MCYSGYLKIQKMETLKCKWLSEPETEVNVDVKIEMYVVTFHHCCEKSTDPRNCILEGPREMMRLASPSPSTSGGGVVSFWGLTRRQVMRVGAVQVRGGMMIRRPWCRLPRIEPPRASTIKLTRKLWCHTAKDKVMWLSNDTLHLPLTASDQI